MLERSEFDRAFDAALGIKPEDADPDFFFLDEERKMVASSHAIEN